MTDNNTTNNAVLNVNAARAEHDAARAAWRAAIKKLNALRKAGASSEDIAAAQAEHDAASLARRAADNREREALRKAGWLVSERLY